MAFVSATWWDLLGKFANTNGQRICRPSWSRSTAASIPAGKDFDSATGKLKNNAAAAAR